MTTTTDAKRLFNLLIEKAEKSPYNGWRVSHTGHLAMRTGEHSFEVTDVNLVDLVVAALSKSLQEAVDTELKYGTPLCADLLDIEIALDELVLKCSEVLVGKKLAYALRNRDW